MRIFARCATVLKIRNTDDQKPMVFQKNNWLGFRQFQGFVTLTSKTYCFFRKTDIKE